MKNIPPLHPPFFSNTFCFLPFCFSFFFFSFSHFSSHPLSFSPHFLPIFSFLFGFLSSFWSINRMRQKEEVSSPPSSSQMSGYPFSIFFFYFIIPLFMTSSLTWLNMSHGIISHTWLIVSHSFNATCHSLGVPGGIPNPCHVAFDIPRLEKREIPTTSESNEIRRGYQISRDDFNGEVRLVFRDLEKFRIFIEITILPLL